MRTLVALTLALAAPAFAVESGHAPVNGLKLYYEIHGSPSKDGVPLVLLHGGGSTIETSFGKLIPLVSRTRQVIAFEQQGHGHTADVDRPFSFGQSAEDAVALLRGVVRSLILESVFFSREGTDPRFWQSFDHAKLDDMPTDLKAAYRATAPNPEQLPSFFAKSVQRMREFKVQGDRDIVRVEHAAQMQHLLPDARLAVLPGADHAAVPDRAAAVAPMLDEFLNGVVNASRDARH